MWGLGLLLRTSRSFCGLSRLIMQRARFDLGLDLSDDSVQETKVAAEDFMGDFQQNPVLDRDGLRQIERRLACLVQTVGRNSCWLPPARAAACRIPETE